MKIKEYAEKLGLDEEDFKELITLFIDTSISDLENMKSALDENDFEKARDAAHSIKGAAGNLGFMDIWEVSSKCEKASKAGNSEEIGDTMSILSDQVEKLKLLE